MVIDSENWQQTMLDLCYVQNDKQPSARKPVHEFTSQILCDVKLVIKLSEYYTKLPTTINSWNTLSEDYRVMKISGDNKKILETQQLVSCTKN